jgi:cytoskeletal protein RodZ
MPLSSYDFEILKQTREKQKIKISDIALNLCLSERHIVSMEENRLDFFMSDEIRMISVRKYSIALGLNPTDVICSIPEPVTPSKNEENIEELLPAIQNEEIDSEQPSEPKKPNILKRLFGLN